jgi:alpha-L-fucosidase
MTQDAEQKMKWWRDDKFGMFIHWGCYSVLGRGEQIMARDWMPFDEYKELAEQFDPAPDWADQVADQAVRAGAKYVVLTTMHHDGYCLFKTETDSFNAVETGPGRDLVAEFVAALRKRNLRVGLYYSVLNWRWKGYWAPEEHPDDLVKMVDQVHAQVRELLTNYGKVDILWYDAPRVPGSVTPGSIGYQARDNDQSGAVEFYRTHELTALARELQPEIIINNRAGGDIGDFGTPEQHVSVDSERPWEACMTLNHSPGWGNIRHSIADKTAGDVLYNFMEAVRLGGNFLFNIGPDAKGQVTPRDRDALDRIGKWLEVHGEAVYGMYPGDIYTGPTQGPVFQYGMFTSKENIAYLTIFYYPGDYLIISKLGPAIRKATMMCTGQELTVEAMKNARWKISGLPETPPCDLAPVIKIEFEAPPYLLTHTDGRWLDGTYEATALPHST